MGWSLLAEATGAGQDALWAALPGAAFIFLARVTDMSIDTLRVLALVRGKRYKAAVLGFLEAGIFISALSLVLVPPLHWIQILGYASGFGVGTLMGMFVGRLVATDFVLMRILSRTHGRQICDCLRGEGIAVTEVTGQGRDGPIPILFTLAKRVPAQHALDLVRRIDANAFVVIEPIQQAIGGHLPNILGRAVAVRR